MVPKKKQVKRFRIQYVRSAVGRPEVQKKIVKGLGFRRLNQVLECPDTPEIRGMVNKVNHLVKVVGGEES